MRFRFTTIAAASATMLVGCSHIAQVGEVRPRFRPLHTAVGALVAVEKGISQALQLEKRDPMDALGGFLTAAEEAAKQLERKPSDTAARNAYNFAVARVFTTIHDAKLDPWKQPLRVPASGGDFTFTHKPDPLPNRNPELYEFMPADQLRLKGTYVSKRITKQGLGAPLVAAGKELRKDAKEEFATSRTYRDTTAVVRFDKGRRAAVEFMDPLQTETVRLNGRTFPLAADYTASTAVMLVREKPQKLGLARLLRPAKYDDTARIARLQAYDPDKTVVLVVHGLMSSPDTWTPMINELRGDPEIRKRYQFWFFSYPSGYPYPYSAAILRRELDAVQKKFPMRKPMVVIGHSMGGCISRLLITDTGDRLWMDMFNKPPDQVPLPPATKKLFTEALIFKHRPEVGRVIFISAPLRGADLAKGWLGRMGARLVRLPGNLITMSTDAVRLVTFQPGAPNIKHAPTSVDTLSPDNRFVKAINNVPITPGIPYHTIAGDRGKCDAPNGNDGLVPYWSSHMAGAKSEVIVPSGHGAHQNEKAIQEVGRILHLHRPL